jgi:hypothetical protein
MAIELGSMDPESGIALAQLFDQLKLSLNKQREILMLVKEIARREDRSVLEVFADSHLKDILQHNELDRSQKSQKIRHYLKQRRYPTIYEMEKRLDTHLKKLDLGNQMRLEAPKDFEGTSFTLSLTFRNLSEFQALQTRLEKLRRNSSFINLLERKTLFSD